jgi:Kef-type K+ transport system membrane component KefB
MNELSSLGLILLLALLAGHLVKVIRIPEVTGYILAGVALGPSVLGWVSHDNLQALKVLSEVALGLILFSIGSVFEFERFRRIGDRIVRLTLIESALAAALVVASILLLGERWQIAMLLGAIAIATAPASTLMVIRECNGKGPLSEALLGIIAVNNIICIIAYLGAAAVINLVNNWGASGIGMSLYRAGFPLVWQLVGSVALGFLVGLMLAGWATQVTETGEMLILLAGSILLCVGAARIYDLSALVASLAVGATMVNLSSRSRRLFKTLGETDPPFYAIFFVIAGADLNLDLVGSMGVLGVAYLVMRALGKFVGARIGARRLKMEPQVQSFLGFGLMAQAGLAVGLTITVGRQFPQYYPVISTVILSSVVVYEMFGPISTKFAIVQSGEARLGGEATQSIWV